MTNREQLAAIVKEHQALSVEIADARAMHAIVADLRRRFDEQAEACLAIQGRLHARQKRLEQLINQLVDGEEWQIGGEPELNADTWWDETAE